MRTTVYRESQSTLALTSVARVNGTANGATIDRTIGSNPSVLFVVTTGTVTDGTHTFTVQESDDGTTWTAAPAGSVQGQPAVALTAGANNFVFDVGYFGNKRYCRLTVTTTGATTGGVYSASAVLYGRRVDR